MSSLFVSILLVISVCVAAIGVYVVTVHVVGIEITLAESQETPASKLQQTPPLCGQVARLIRQKRIVGGTKTEPGQYPWVVMILVRGRHVCGGSVVDARHVLTAAHCLRKRHPGPSHGNGSILFVDAREVELIAGKHEYKLISRRNDSTSDEQRVSVRNVIPHHEYDDTNSAKRHDLAMLVLNTPLQWTKWVKSVCLPELHDYLPENKTGTVVGWGSIKPRNRAMWRPTLPEVLQQLPVKVYLENECKRWVDSKLMSRMTDNQICAESKADKSLIRTACTGDSGGPLFALEQRERGEHYVQFGVLSWGFCPPRPGAPFFFTHLPPYLPWIQGFL